MEMIKTDSCMRNVDIKCRSVILSHEVFIKVERKRTEKKKQGASTCHTCRP